MINKLETHKENLSNESLSIFLLNKEVGRAAIFFMVRVYLRFN